MEKGPDRDSDLLAVLLGGVLFLVGTTPGLHLLLNGAARWVPWFSIKQVDGGWRNLTLKDVQYEMPGVTVSAGEFHLAVQLGCLKTPPSASTIWG